MAFLSATLVVIGVCIGLNVTGIGARVNFTTENNGCVNAGDNLVLVVQFSKDSANLFMIEWYFEDKRVAQVFDSGCTVVDYDSALTGQATFTCEPDAYRATLINFSTDLEGDWYIICTDSAFKTYKATKTVAICSDPCHDAVLLGSLFLRTSNYELEEGQDPLCDYYIKNDWYKMGEYVIASSGVGCGTTYPWYRTGTLPENEQEAALVTICKNDRRGNDCAAEKKIQVMKCPRDEYVFRLPPTDSCPEAYCVEDMTPDNRTEAPPEICFKPEIHAEVRRRNKENELFFYCDFEPDTDKKFYIVEWFQTSGLSLTALIQSSNPTIFQTKDSKEDFRSKTRCTEQDLKRHGIRRLGFNIKCSVSASWKLASRPGKPVFSDDKFVGIQARNVSSVALKNNEKVEVFYRLTVPFGCEENMTECSLDTNIFIPKYDSCVVADVSLTQNLKQPCGIRFTNKEVGVDKPIVIQGLLSKQLPPQERQLTVRLATHPIYTAHELFQKYFIEPLSVRIETDTERLTGKKCHSYNDPHMLQFNGGKYENQNKGTFILYKNKKHKTQVQIQTSQCPNWGHDWKPYCNCGAVVAAGRDVFVMNNCEKKIGWDISFKQCGDMILKEKVLEIGSGYIVHLPTGGEVHLLRDTYHGYLNVEIYPSLYDYNESEGLCGLLNDLHVVDPVPPKRKGASVSDNILSWKVDKRESLFERDIGKLLEPYDKDEYLCYCAAKGRYGLQPEATCDAEKVKTCNYKKYKVTRLNDQCTVKQITVRRKKRQARKCSDYADTHFQRQTSFVSNLDRTKRGVVYHKILERSVYDEVTAREACIRELNTTVFQLCQTVPNLDVEPYIDGCTKDAVYTGTMEWASSHLEGIISHCKYQVQVNQPLPESVLQDPDYNEIVNNTENNDAGDSKDKTTTTTAPNPIWAELQKMIDEHACPYNCRGHGVCNKGKCECEAGFADFDCSCDLSVPPAMGGIPDKGLCDLSVRNCRKTSVFGDRFIESGNQKCKLLPFEVTATNSVKYFDNPTLHRATRRSFAEVSCPLPKYSERAKRSASTNDKTYIATGYSISISNDEDVFGEADMIVIFDSLCVNCTKVGTHISCEQDPSYCMRDSRCYSVGEAYGCEICNNDRNTRSAWFQGTECPVDATTPNPRSKKLWIIGAVLGPVFGVAAIVVIVCFIHSVSKNKRYVNASQEQPARICLDQKEISFFKR